MSELVPMSEQRAATHLLRSNLMQGAGQEYYPLPHRNNLLTADQAEKINQRFSIEVYTGIHGVVDGSDKMGCVPAQKDYEAVQQVIDGMTMGDVLFIEGIGYQSPTFRAEFSKRVRDLKRQEAESRAAQSNPFIRFPFGIVGADQILLPHHEALERSRQNYGLHVWAYAQVLGSLRGIDVHYADIDAMTYEQLSVATGYSLEGRRIYQVEPDLNRRISEVRERANANRVKDYALEHLDDVADSQGEAKSRLVVIFGQDHHEGLKRQYDALGLQAQFTRLKSSTHDERVYEQISKHMQDLGAVMKMAMPIEPEQ